MAGHGSRFSKAGYTKPKPLIKIFGVPMIQLVVDNLKPERPHRFIFICQEEHIALYGLKNLLLKISPDCEIISINGVTDGAARTCLLAKHLIDNENELMIANCDQFINANIDAYIQANANSVYDGLIMTMYAADDKWSFVKVNESGNISAVVEKQKISDEATVGIYNFKHGHDFIWASEKMIENNLRVNGEFYVAPVYNELIKRGKKIGFYNIGAVEREMHGLGTPDDLLKFIEYAKANKTMLN